MFPQTLITVSLMALAGNNPENLFPHSSPISSGIYRHYKGDHYLVLFVSRHTETEEDLVVYQSLYGDFKIWSRPLAMFSSNIEYQGVQQPRFKKVAEAGDAKKFITPKSVVR